MATKKGEEMKELDTETIGNIFTETLKKEGINCWMIIGTGKDKNVKQINYTGSFRDVAEFYTTIDLELGKLRVAMITAEAKAAKDRKIQKASEELLKQEKEKADAKKEKKQGDNK